jgi:hypothetical protein
MILKLIHRETLGDSGIDDEDKDRQAQIYYQHSPRRFCTSARPALLLGLLGQDFPYLQPFRFLVIKLTRVEKISKD